MSSSLMELLSSYINQAKVDLEETARLLGVEPSVARQLCLKVYKCTPQQYYLSQGKATWGQLVGGRLKGIRESLGLSVLETAKLYGHTDADGVVSNSVYQWVGRVEKGRTLNLANIYLFIQATQSMSGIGTGELFAGLPLPEVGKKGTRGRKRKCGVEA